MRRLPIIEIENNRDVFALFAAMNAMGYSDENRREGMSPIRRRARKILGQHEYEKSYPQLKHFFETHHPWGLLNSLFSSREQASSNNTLKLYLGKFFDEPTVRKFWQTYKTFQTKEVTKLFPLFKRELVQVIMFLGKPIKIKKVVFIINYLDAFWRGYSLKIGNTFYVIVGPGAKKNKCELIRHEILHALVPHIRLPVRFTAPAIHQNAVKIGYQNSSVINQEYIVRSFNLLYESRILHKNISKAIRNERKMFPFIEKILALIQSRQKDRLH
jgi:hypothetical protein